MLNFLRFLFDDYVDNLWIEVRRIGPPSQRFFHIQNLQAVADDATGDTNVFVGVLPRKVKGGKATDVCPNTDILWADIDKKNGLTFEHILNDGFLPQPNVILDSGHGWHLYWKLDRTIGTDEAQQLMGDIASVLGGDAVGDPARIMRLPDTMNEKEGCPPIRTRLLRFDNKQTHRPSDFFIGSHKNPFKKRGDPTRRKMNGVKTRSEELFGIAVDGVLHGRTRAQIKQMMKDHPAGSKLAEMPAARREQWITNALHNAKRITSRSPRG